MALWLLGTLSGPDMSWVFIYVQKSTGVADWKNNGLEYSNGISGVFSIWFHLVSSGSLAETKQDIDAPWEWAREKAIRISGLSLLLPNCKIQSSSRTLTLCPCQDPMNSQYHSCRIYDKVVLYGTVHDYSAH